MIHFTPFFDIRYKEEEYSIAALIPYIKYYVPDAKVVPLLLHGDLGIDGSVQLAREIGKAAGDRDWVIIGSVDFSHYLPPDSAGKMDDVTLQAIEPGDFEALDRMGNDNLDSPPAVITVLEAVKETGADGLKVTGHSNSAAIAGKYNESTTSYFAMLFYDLTP